MSLKVQTRSMTAVDHFNMEAKSTIQFALECDSLEAVNKVIDYYKKSVIALHIKQAGNNLVSHNDEVPVFKIPDSNLSLQDASYFVSKYFTRPYTESLASIAAGDRKVILNINHNSCDGGYLKFLLDHFYTGPPDHLPPFQVPSAELYAKQFEKAPYVLPWESDPYMTRAFSTDPDSPRIGNDGAKYYTIRTPAKSLICYDKMQSKIKGYTEALWLSHILSASAHNGNIAKFGGVCTCVDLRQWLGRPADFSILDNFAAVTPSAPLNKHMTLHELASLLRDDLKRKIKNNEQFGFLKSLGKPNNAKIIPGVGLEITSMGSLKLKKPFVDAWASLSVLPLHTDKLLSLMTFGVETDIKNEIVIRLRYGPKVFSDREMTAYGKSLNHFLHNITYDRTVGSALEELKNFQKSVF